MISQTLFRDFERDNALGCDWVPENVMFPGLRLTEIPKHREMLFSEESITKPLASQL